MQPEAAADHPVYDGRLAVGLGECSRELAGTTVDGDKLPSTAGQDEAFEFIHQNLEALKTKGRVVFSACCMTTLFHLRIWHTRPAATLSYAGATIGQYAKRVNACANSCSKGGRAAGAYDALGRSIQYAA